VQLTIRPVVCPDEQPAPSPGTTTPVAAASTVVAGRRSRRTA
jgi:hypothetical protein